MKNNDNKDSRANRHKGKQNSLILFFHENPRFARSMKLQKILSKNLTDNEKDIVKLIVQGYSFRQVAFGLDLKYNTLNYKVKKLYKKIEESRRPEGKRTLELAY